ncbi:hypothetical protein BDM02DRAFT_3197270 [Thelephora ganbajun]|uniref:Uncharacterized protein n=1 Tax=Thelephora ganbajun TaxID=370292 RepID=A0ACB6ZRW9_THEGA|nr:hypothetical protein BDM02DRAFT_3197270 [Thelephora ganbajun]
MTATPTAHELVDIHARLSASARIDLALNVLGVGNLSITAFLMYRLHSADTCHFKNAFSSEGGGLETFLKELAAQYPAAEGCIFWAAGHNLTLKASAVIELVESHTLLSSAEWEARGLTWPQIVNVIIHQLVNFRSQNSQRFQVPFGLSLLAHGAPRAVIDVLEKLHLSPCFGTMSSTAVTLANGCITEAITCPRIRQHLSEHVVAYRTTRGHPGESSIWDGLGHLPGVQRRLERYVPNPPEPVQDRRTFVCTGHSANTQTTPLHGDTQIAKESCTWWIGHESKC